jgi:hypothetical protein
MIDQITSPQSVVVELEAEGEGVLQVVVVGFSVEAAEEHLEAGFHGVVSAEGTVADAVDSVVVGIVVDVVVSRVVVGSQVVEEVVVDEDGVEEDSAVEVTSLHNAYPFTRDA